MNPFHVTLSTVSNYQGCVHTSVVSSQKRKRQGQWLYRQSDRLSLPWPLAIRQTANRNNLISFPAAQGAKGSTATVAIACVFIDDTSLV